MTVMFNWPHVQHPTDKLGRWQYYRGAPDSQHLDAWTHYESMSEPCSSVYPLHFAYMVRDMEDTYNGALDRLALKLGVPRKLVKPR